MKRQELVLMDSASALARYQTSWDLSFNIKMETSKLPVRLTAINTLDAAQYGANDTRNAVKMSESEYSRTRRKVCFCASSDAAFAA
jgi:hypothetical protein